jgi:dihydrofolate reductase
VGGLPLACHQALSGRRPLHASSTGGKPHAANSSGSIESALRQARAVAGDRDIRIAGGADAIEPYLRAGLVETIASPRVTHMRYAVRKP